MSLNWNILPPSVTTTRELPLARATDPKTSHTAHDPSDLNAVRALVLDVLRQHPDGLTDTELNDECDAIGKYDVDTDTYRRRRSDLFNLGLVEATELRRPSRTGRPSIVWKAAQR